MGVSAKRAGAAAALGIALSVAGGSSGGALAYEGQLTLGLGLGYAAVVTEGLPPHGALAQVSASVGLDDVWTVQASVSYALHPGADPLHVGIVGAELIYVLDVLEVVPFFGLGADAIGTVHQGRAGADAAAHAILGVDYLLSRTWLIGLDVRPYVLFTRLSTDPVYITISARASLIFDL